MVALGCTGEEEHNSRGASRTLNHHTLSQHLLASPFFSVRMTLEYGKGGGSCGIVVTCDYD